MKIHNPVNSVITIQGRVKMNILASSKLPPGSAAYLREISSYLNKSTRSCDLPYDASLWTVHVQSSLIRFISDDGSVMCTTKYLSGQEIYLGLAENSTLKVG